MNPEYGIHATQYYTVTIYEWQDVLSDDRHKDIIIDSFQYLADHKRIELSAFVIMSNHIHLIQRILPNFALTGMLLPL